MDEDKELVREVNAEVVGDVARGRGYAWRLLGACRLRCQRGGRVHDALECITCPRFVNFVPSRDGTHVRIRCLWSEDDCVGDVMTKAPELVSVRSDTRIFDAVKRARAARIHHLIVIDEDQPTGVVCRCALVPPILGGETVADRMSSRLHTIHSWDSLSRAVALMKQHQIGCLPVMSETKLVGIITRSDLLAAGFAAERFGCELCDRCGGHHALRRHPTLDHITFCVDCLEETMVEDDYLELDT